MPGMFSRRRAGSNASRSSVHLPQTTHSSAAAAASQAFLGRPASSGSLSSAAAAAALRSTTTSPEPVGSIQTKRMVRRGSQSSIGTGSIVSARGGAARPALQRAGSSGSMTERTFRSPSPGRANGTVDGAVSPAPDAPPVPALPKNLPQHQRSSSLDRPQRMTSPTPADRGARTASMDRNSMPPTTSRKAKRLSNVNEEMERALERTNSGGNVNFSRPRTSNPSSPVSPPAEKEYTHGTGHWFSEPAVGMTNSGQDSKQAALDAKIARIQAAAGQPVKRDHSAGSSQGAHLGRANHQVAANSSSASHINAPFASYQTADAIMVYDPNSRTFVSRPNPKPKPAPRPVPAVTKPAALPPGTYDPHTRTVVPTPAPKMVALTTATSGPQQRPIRPSVATNLVPPARNPARLSAETSPTSSRAYGLQKQPSVVREEPEEEDAISSQAGSARASTTKPIPAPHAQVHATPTLSKQRASSLDIPNASLESALRGRGGSTSPSPNRSAHFSVSPVVEATRHNPPARDVSPAKSALKHSPASSVRAASPLAHFSAGPKSPVSETSDIDSQASQDAFTGRKKKSVRVSFDEQPREIELAPPKSTVRARSPVIDDLDDEELMKPRPALPSFGSVRKQRNEAPVVEKVTEMAPERHEVSSDHAVGGILKNAHHDNTSANEPLPPEVTSKETSGSISDDSDTPELGSPTASSTPAMPVTDTATTSSADEPVVRDFAATSESHHVDDADVPAINLLPPTPGVEEDQSLLAPGGEAALNPRHSADINVPGGWSKEVNGQAESSSDNALASSEYASGLTAEDVAPVIYASPQPRSPLLDAVNEESDDDAEFSDAAEDLSELDNGGFASLDAIAVSPLQAVSPTAAVVSESNASPPASPSVEQALKKPETLQTGSDQGSGDWSQATAYWSQLSKQQRQQIEREHFSSDDEYRPPRAARKGKKKTTSRAAEATDKTNENAAVAQASSKGATAAPTTMKKTMRAESGPAPVDNSVHMKRSMRAGSGGGMAASLRDGPGHQRQRSNNSLSENRGTLQKRSMRPASPSSQFSDSSLPASAAGASMVARRGQTAPTSQDSAYPKIQPKSKPNAAPVMTAKMQKELANDSDSESSFKKKRRPAASTVDTQGRYSMKRSMRGGPAQPVTAPSREARPVSPTPPRGKGKDSFSIRSLSPTGSLFGRRKRVEEVRQSIRGTSVDGGSRLTMRNGPPPKSSLRKQSAQAAKPATGSRFKSRFADSDDEDEDDRPQRGFFKSRFADSDDDDDDVFTPADLAPVRGIPRKQGQTDGDSTDLEDEDDDVNDRRKASRRRAKQTVPIVPATADIDAAMELARKKLGIPAEGESQAGGAALRQGTMKKPNEAGVRPQVESVNVGGTPEKKKRGFMGSILRRNRASTASVPTTTTAGTGDAQEMPSTPNAADSPAIATSPSTKLAARPQSPVSPNGKLVRRASQQQTARIRPSRGDSNYSTATAPAMVGDRSDWPLPPPVPELPSSLGGEQRPNTSDGAGRGKAGSVRFEDGTTDGAGRGVYSQRTGRKKKFGLLRRAFGLDD